MNRFPPAGPVTAYKTYGLRSPDSHFRPATCAETNCQAYAHGWTTLVDVASPLGASQANYIRLHSRRSYTVTEVGTLVTFTFGAGQTCFAAHRVALEVEPLCLIRGGDWRAVTTPTQRLGTQSWLDDFGEHQETIKEAVERG